MTPRSTSFIHAALAIARLELGFFLRWPRLLLAAAVVVLIPALYVVIYLASVWDPAARTGALPVALVNLDQGLVYRGQSFNIGHEVIANIRAKPGFGYLDVASEALAREQVRQGQLAFALIVPADFSSNAIPGAQAGAGKLVVYTSEGNSYPSAGLARRFAEDLGREVNQSLNEQRWELVLADAAGSQRSIDRLHDGVVQLQLGASELAGGTQQAAKATEALTQGATRVDRGVTQLTSGNKALADGIKAMFAQRARNSQLNRLDEGSKALLDGQAEMGRVLTQLHQGAQTLQTGVNGFREQANDSVFVATSVREGLDQVAQGVGTLEAGLKAVGPAQQKLGDGATQLHDGVSALTNGVRGLNTGLRSMVAQLPEDARLDELAQGTGNLSHGLSTLKTGSQKMAAGAQHLAGGLALLESALPAQVPKMDGNAQGLATSVQPLVEVVARVQNNGSGFAPNIIPGALWLGASLAAFLFHLRRLPRLAMQASPLARMLGKITWPIALVLLQALLVWFALLFILQLQAQNSAALALILLLSSAVFLLIIFALTRAWGDAGKALALIFLAVQLSSSGGILPVELSGGLFAQISPYLPITWVVKAIKASLFGAFEGDWQTPLHGLLWVGLWAAAASSFIGRWRYVSPLALRPALDL